LSVGMGYFFQDGIGSDKISITRQGERIRVERRPHQEKGEVDYIYVALETKKTNKNMEPFLVEFPIRDTEDMVFMSHEGEEFLYVTEGEVEFRTVDRLETLQPGDSIYFESDISHSFRCASEKSAKALAVIWNKT